MTERPRDLIPGSERAGRRRTLDQVTSVRFPGRSLITIRLRAEAAGITISDWLRIAAGRQIAAEDAPAEPVALRATGWQCPHLTITASAGVLSDIRAHCGCQMHPAYATA